MSACDKYDLAEDKVKAFTRSSVRTKTLLCLKDKPKISGDLEDELKLRATTILHTLKDLIEEDLVTKDKRGYVLTNIGRIQAMLLDDLMGTIVAMDNQKEFWLNHDISGIPEELQKKIGMLMQSEIITSNPADILKSHAYFLERLKAAKEIHGVSPIIAPGHYELSREAIKAGIQVELIITDEIIKILMKENPDLESDLLKRDNFKLYRLSERVKVAFTVTDSVLSLGLYRPDGTYDLTGDLICFGEDAQRWGMELFNYYRNKAERVRNS